MLLLDLDRPTAAHLSDAVRLYLETINKRGYQLDPSVRKNLLELQAAACHQKPGQTGSNRANQDGPALRGDHYGTDVLLTQKQAASRAHCTPRTIRRWIDQGLLPAVQVGGLRRISSSDLERFLEHGNCSSSHQTGVGGYE